MAEAVVSFLVERVGDIIIQEGRSLSGVGNQVRRAHTDLKFIRGYLKDADSKQQESETIRIFVAETRDVAYDLEDVIATFVLKVDSRRIGGVKNVLKRFGCIFTEGVHRHRIGKQIGVITDTISHLKLNLDTYNLINSGGATSISSKDQKKLQLRRTYSHIIERHVVGQEDSVHELVEHLVKEEHHHRVVSIWGMGGSGKSTLAKQVYHHEDVKQHFDCFAWVCISQQYQVRDVLERIYIKLISASNEQREEIAKLKDDELPGRLSRFQNEKKCLIVLDDIWKTETWDFLKAAFECEEYSKSRILLTTRNEKIALHADKNSFQYRPPKLDEIQSWELFEKIAMRERRNAQIEDYKKIEKLGREMVQHCAGLPLAVIVLAGLLAGKNTVKDWETVQKNVGVYICRGFGRPEEEHAYVSWVLALSYDDLPYHLKPCFLYLGQFPEDGEIKVKNLTKLWIAEGFISLTQQQQGLGETMEDVAYNWLNELVERCLIQVGRECSMFGLIKTCKMHDLLRDLCLSKAEEENFLKVVMHPSSFSMASNASPLDKIRRLAIYLDEHDEKLVPSRDDRGVQVRSLLYFGPNDSSWFPQHKKIIPTMFRGFKLLRVLRVEGMGYLADIKLPNEIGNMVHLRYLSLRRSGVKLFPRFLGKLICLQTLDFRVQESNIFIPNVIWKMTRLRHLYLPSNYTARGELQLSTLVDLQTLYYVSSEYSDLNDLSKHGNLRKVSIRLSPMRSKAVVKISEAAENVLSGIRSLVLGNEGGVESGGEVSQILAKCGQIYKLRLWGPQVELPKKFYSYSNLTLIILRSCALKDDQIAKLEKLPNLTSLTLWGNVFEENTSGVMAFSSGSFPRLQFLSLKFLVGITEWRVEEGAMPSLSKLSIYSGELSAVPDGLRHLTTLKELEIWEMPESFCKKLEEGGEDFHKVQDIPCRLIIPQKNNT